MTRLLDPPSKNSPMELTFECPECHAVGRVPRVEDRPTATCGRCGHVRELHPSATEGGRLSACAWCATTDLYIQKDFPHGLGLGIVVVGFVVSSVFWYYLLPIAAYAVLLATAALDLVLYYLVPDVTICYRCLCQHRGAGSNPDDRFAPFDLAIGERYRQERLRVEEHRARQESAEPVRPG
jgi:transcription elongation factor Elf1